MAGALLHSGTAREFRALGADGQPVYSAAVPLRETIRLKLGADAANCLAVVQPSDTGERFDWYAPFDGDVIPWSAATQEERESAYAQLAHVHSQMLATAGHMEDATGSREKQVFARLLRRALQFPGSEHVYLVDGKPVITFWGFARPGAEHLDPLLCLRPVATAAIPAAVPAAVPVVVQRSPWRWLWWLLLLLLLLALLLFGMRACAPETPLPLGLHTVDLPGLPAAQTEDVRKIDAQGRPIADDPRATRRVGARGDRRSWWDRLRGVDGVEAPGDLGDDLVPGDGIPVDDGTDLIDEGAGGQDAGGQDAGGLPEDGLPEDGLPEDGLPEDDLSGVPPPELDDASAPDGLPPPDLDQESNPQDADASDPDAPGMEPPTLDDAPGGQPQRPPLDIPADALQDGNADFLKGRWDAGSGVQDAQTGKPLSLNYDFNDDGTGEVRIQRGDGVECKGAVAGSMQGGRLGINGQGQAACSDGSRYDLPRIECTPGSGRADCQGIYQNQRFPIRMNR